MNFFGFITFTLWNCRQVASLGIEILTFLIDRLGHDFRPRREGRGEGKIAAAHSEAARAQCAHAPNTLREAHARIYAQKCQNSRGSAALFGQHFERVRHSAIETQSLTNVCCRHGAHSLTLSKFIPDIVRLLSDPTSSVRDTASATLVDLYRHVGEKLRMDIQKRNLVPQAKWQLLSSRFDEVRNRGELLPTASKTIEPSFDEVDRLQRTPAPVKMSSASTVKSKPNSANANSAGAVDEELFLRSFEDVPNMQIFSPRDVTDTMKTIYATISDSSKDWNKRVEALKKMRSLVMAGATHYEDFYVELKRFDIALQASIKDLRSQVVRETCITIAYLSQTLEAKFDKMAEMLLHHLIMLIQNSAKIMATSGEVAVKFIIKHIPNPRLIPIITNNATTSKSKEIRRACCEFIESMLALWPSHSLERHVVLLQEAIKKGVADADPEARVLSRKAFHRLRDHFPDHAESLLQSLEPSYRRALQGGETMSSSCSNSNLNSCFKSSRMYAKPTGVQSASDTPGRNGFRSNSAIDLQAAQRAKARAQYSAMARNKIQSGTASLPRPKRTVETLVNPSPERVSRTRNRNSQSQRKFRRTDSNLKSLRFFFDAATSRSGSPSSRLAYLYNRSTDHDSPRPRRTSSGIPRSSQGSRDTSRETSPNRSTGISRFRRGADRPPLSPASRPVLAQKILQQSREAENALADAFNDSSESQYRAAGRKSMRSIDNHSDESETSSICSERSFDSYKRQSDDINEIIVLCASTTWQERRDGLLSLQSYLAQDVKLTDGELKHLTEIFAKMFTDAHTKGMALFLDTLQEVIKMHKDDLEYWIYVLLQRVFMKIGGETLNSIASKLISTLELVRVCFGVDQLIPNVYRFLLDATQTPNVKSKTVMLNFLTSLCSQPDAAAAIVAPSNALQALQKIIAHSQDAKSMEIRQAAKVCIVALWNCDTAAVTLLLTELPKEQQDIASNIVHNHMRKTSTGSEPGSPMVPSSPKPPQSPSTPPFGDQEEVYKSLRRTTAEIQNYSFETLGPKLDGDRDTTSQDSGISQMSAGNDMRNDIAAIEEKMEDLNSRQFGLQSGSRSLPFAGLNGISETDSNGCRSLGDIKDSDAVVRDVIERCCIDHTTSVADKRKLLTQVLDLVHQGHVQGVMENFKKLLRIFIDHLAAGDTQNRILSLKIIAAIFQNSSLKCVWEKYVELITLKVLNAHSDEKREVIKEAETTAAAMARCVSPFDTVVYTLAPLIRTSPYPEDLGALKMLTKLVEANPEQITDQHLKEIMPGILKVSRVHINRATGTDHNESPVRKSSIFCMVALYKAVGEERLADYISGLTGSKVRLLRLYITRAEQQTTPNDTPKNAS
ncbi:hypothetical protein D910_06147 [Dendroctonus ponderosae]|uniref:TOG domain-containing protein n=1 Tax=Dendroctonus ponderosae TaxID=77166 RepID=U4UFS1_DENPD|nr:hypothetical protein D910_06147 [Dendroctonus ponderosae]